MSRRRIIHGALVAVVAIAATGTLVAAMHRRAGSGSLPRVERVEARPALLGGEHRFGDLIEGRLDVLVPLDAVDLTSVSATFRLAPYRLVGPVRTERLTAGATGRVRYRFAIDCLESKACLPRGDRAGFAFKPSAIRYRMRAGAVHSLTVNWPALRVRPRPRPDILAPWEDGLRPLPTPGYRAPPQVVAALAALLSALGLVGAAALLRPLVRTPGSSRREQATGLERALEAVRVAAARRDVDERRRALDLLSRALRTATKTEARRLAWSRPLPHGMEMNELADRVERGSRG